ncbi:ribosomal protein S18-alanine N-acetyltransferase [Synechococcus sp. BS55D]|uniref:ribosomal protein S18-alanine N-acetyltransferase n=1 Tax=Synechococcus sp. BS55D TaxID=2055943 RepID=UPI00103F6E82|nr:ribosomal protein S18-alanine N-acetyltransferase [Synechococcus sp. BS55D]TCD57411.1 ribosomal-protein-alanine N-acetyltransferase [Synechococcus sp. BS55D]
MESQTTVTTLGAGDAKACRDLDEAALGGLWTLQQWTHELSEAQRICLGLFDGPRLVALACGWMVVDELHITAVAVAPERRRCGFGRVLLEALLRRAADDGARHATLEVASCNAAALALYSNCGFETAGCRRNYYSDGRDALIQWRKLT